MAAAVQAKYPHIRFRRRSFPQGEGFEKLTFIESCLAEKRPVLVSVSCRGLNSISPPDMNWGLGWHIMLAVSAKEDEIALFKRTLARREGEIATLRKEDLASIHDNFPGGDDVAVLDERGSS